VYLWTLPPPYRALLLGLLHLNDDVIVSSCCCLCCLCNNSFISTFCRPSTSSSAVSMETRSFSAFCRWTSCQRGQAAPRLLRWRRALEERLELMTSEDQGSSWTSAEPTEPDPLLPLFTSYPPSSSSLSSTSTCLSSSSSPSLHSVRWITHSDLSSSGLNAPDSLTGHLCVFSALCEVLQSEGPVALCPVCGLTGCGSCSSLPCVRSYRLWVL